MLSLIEIAFWLSMAFVGYTYAIYPLLIAVLARLWGRPLRRTEAAPTSLSVVIAAYNEGAILGRRVRELVELLAASGFTYELIVVSDGSTDDTTAVVRQSGDARTRVIELSRNAGKAVALSTGCAAAQHEVIVFGDARQSWAPDALARLLAAFADPAVGAVSGNLELEARPGVMTGVSRYWQYEKWIRVNESRLHSTVGVTGAISAVRRQLFTPIPPGAILDDVYWPLQVVLQGHRVVYEWEARAIDRLPERPRDEFRRKVRTLTGNFQLMAYLPQALVPWRNPVFVQLVSHKLFRLAVPWALLVILLTSAFLPEPVYQLLFAAQLSGYGLGLLALWKPLRQRLRVAALASAFLMLNAAAGMALWVWLSGRAAQSWSKATYARSGTQSPLVPPVELLPESTSPAAEPCG